MTPPTILLFLAGLVLLVLGANALVRGAADLAAGLGVPPLVVGLTIVAFGTSAPEVLVSFQAASAGEAGIALGNVVGSNIFNVLFILGVSALIAPLRVSAQLVRLDVPIMIGVSVVALVMALDSRIGIVDGSILVAGIVAYTALLIRQAVRGGPAGGDDDAQSIGPMGAHWSRNLVRIAVGLAMLVLGARWLVNSAIEIAAVLGVSDLVIGLTVVAAGTSLPEVATSIAATVRGERDIAVGNVVGSNIFNLLLVLGGAALVGGGISVPAAALTFDLPVMTAVAVACLPIFFTGYTIARWEGAVFLVYYVAYTAFVVLDATDHEVLPIFYGIMFGFVIPLTLLTSILIWWRKLKADRSAPPQS